MTVVPDWKAGSTPALRWWLVLMILFFILGYDWLLSIILGAIGGGSLWVISAFWNAKDDERIVTKTEAVVEAKEVVETTSKRIQVRHYGESHRHREKKSVRRFGWLFRKK